MKMDLILGVRLDAKLMQRLVQRARSEDRKPSEWVRRLVVRELAAQNKKES